MNLRQRAEKLHKDIKIGTPRPEYKDYLDRHQIDAIEKALAEVIDTNELLDVLKEAREQLGWLNQQNVMASTNVVLKRLDQVISAQMK